MKKKVLKVLVKIVLIFWIFLLKFGNILNILMVVDIFYNIEILLYIVINVLIELKVFFVIYVG